jgi:hypothetical protein
LQSIAKNEAHHGASHISLYQRTARENDDNAHPDEQAKQRLSADANCVAICAREDAGEASGRIVMHLWIIFMLLLLVLGILFVILRISIHDCGGYFDFFRQGSNIAHSP